MSETTQNQPDKVDENAPKPGEPDTDTRAGRPIEAPESKDGEQPSKQDQKSKEAPRTPRVAADSRSGEPRAIRLPRSAPQTEAHARSRPAAPR